MTIGTLFTLFIVPSLYMLIARKHDEGTDKEMEAVETNGGLESELELPEPVLARGGNGDWRAA